VEADKPDARKPVEATLTVHTQVSPVPLTARRPRKNRADRRLRPLLDPIFAVAAPRALETFRWQAAAIALLVLIAYANSLGSGFHFDDSDIFLSPPIVSPGFGLDLFRLEQTRPLTYLTFHWNYLLGGRNPDLYHLFNLLLHAANSILLLALARRYLPPLAAGCAAVLFALHPLQTESVTYVFARATLLSTHFALWCLWLHARGKYLSSALLFGVSLAAKEETIALPAFLLLLDLFERRRPRLGYYAALAGFGALATAHLLYLIHNFKHPGFGWIRGFTTLDYLLTQARVVWIYLRLLIAPVGLNLDHDVPFSTGLLTPWTTLPAIVAFAALAAGLVWAALQRRSPAALWALGFFVLLAPSSSILPQGDAMFEHRTYLPLVCMTIAAGFLLRRVPRPKLVAAFAILIPAMVAGTITRNAAWHDEKTLWTDVAAQSPGKGRSWLGLSKAYADDPAKALEYLNRGLAVEPDNPELHNNLGIALLGANQPGDALAHFQRAMAVTGETSDLRNNIGGAYFRMNNLPAALDSFERALQLDPCSFNARRNVMMVHSQRNEPVAVWQAGEIPPACTTMIPSDAAEIERLRHLAGRPR
jgi:tetratricopeptide (TPR) repeat protein